LFSTDRFVGLSGYPYASRVILTPSAKLTFIPGGMPSLNAFLGWLDPNAAGGLADL